MARRRVQPPDQSARPSRHGATQESNSDEEAANTESQQMLALGPLLRKRKTDDKEVQQFSAKVAADRERLKARLDQRIRQAEDADTRRHDKIASMILNALKTPNRLVQDETTVFAGTRIAENAVYMPVADVLSSSEALLEEYERLDKMIADMRDEQAAPVAETWHQDLHEAEQKLQLGARVALRNVKKVLGANFEDDAENTAGDGDDEMQDLNYDLQKSLCYAERGVKRMVKGLPDGEAQ